MTPTLSLELELIVTVPETDVLFEGVVKATVGAIRSFTTVTDLLDWLAFPAASYAFAISVYIPVDRDEVSQE